MSLFESCLRTYKYKQTRVTVRFTYFVCWFMYVRWIIYASKTKNGSTKQWRKIWIVTLPSTIHSMKTKYFASKNWNHFKYWVWQNHKNKTKFVMTIPALFWFWFHLSAMSIWIFYRQKIYIYNFEGILMLHAPLTFSWDFNSTFLLVQVAAELCSESSNGKQRTTANAMRRCLRPLWQPQLIRPLSWNSNTHTQTKFHVSICYSNYACVRSCSRPWKYSWCHYLGLDNR